MNDARRYVGDNSPKRALTLELCILTAARSREIFSLSATLRLVQPGDMGNRRHPGHGWPASCRTGCRGVARFIALPGHCAYKPGFNERTGDGPQFRDQ